MIDIKNHYLNYIIVGCCFQYLFKKALSIFVYFPSIFFFKRFIIVVQEVQSYCRTISATVWEDSRFISIHMVDNPSIVVAPAYIHICIHTHTYTLPPTCKCIIVHMYVQQETEGLICIALVSKDMQFVISILQLLNNQFDRNSCPFILLSSSCSVPNETNYNRETTQYVSLATWYNMIEEMVIVK